MELESIYLNKVSETLARLCACESFLSYYNASKDVYVLEAAILQTRKALESLAFAAVAPNKTKYAEFRAQADKSADFRRDYNARTIMKLLSKINLDFYPRPLSPPISKGVGEWHFEYRQDDSLTKKQFELFYDRLGKFLHADNPWGNDKGLNNLINDLPIVIKNLRLLLSWHVTVIRTPEFTGVWVVEAPTNGNPPHVIVGQADGEFIVQ